MIVWSTVLESVTRRQKFKNVANGRRSGIGLPKQPQTEQHSHLQVLVTAAAALAALELAVVVVRVLLRVAGLLGRGLALVVAVVLAPLAALLELTSLGLLLVVVVVLVSRRAFLELAWSVSRLGEAALSTCPHSFLN